MPNRKSPRRREASAPSELEVLAAALRASKAGTIDRQRLESRFVLRLFPVVFRAMRSEFHNVHELDVPTDSGARIELWKSAASHGTWRALQRACAKRQRRLRSPEKYAYRAARNFLLDELRMRQRRRQITPRLPEEWDGPSAPGSMREPMDRLPAEAFAKVVSRLLGVDQGRDAVHWQAFLTALALQGPTPEMRRVTVRLTRRFRALIARASNADRARVRNACAFLLRTVDVGDRDIARHLSLAPGSVAGLAKRGKLGILSSLRPLLDGDDLPSTSRAAT